MPKSAGVAAEQGDFTLALTVEAGDWGERRRLRQLAKRAIRTAFAETGAAPRGAEVSLVLTDDAHMRTLNAAWRGKDKPTNVLSFPAIQLKPGQPLPPMLGDIVVAHETLAREATLENKPLDHHLIHLIVHGLLHLMGYDHEIDAEAEEMEGVESRALARLAIPDPHG